MKIGCFADDPGGANGIISLATIHNNTAVCAAGPALKYMGQHGVKVEPEMPWDIDALLVGGTRNPDSLSYGYSAEAKKRGIPTFSYIDASINVKTRFCGHTDDPLYHAPDFLFVTETQTIKDFVGLGFPEKKIFDVGNPRYDYVLKRLKGKQRSLNQERKILFLADPVRPTIGDGYREENFGVTCSEDIRSHVLLDRLLELETIKPFDIHIKLHPRNDKKDFYKYLDRCHLYEGDDVGVDLSYMSNIVVGTTTSLLIESAILGVPTIAVLLTSNERQWLPELLPNNLMIATDKDELKTCVDSSLNNKCSKFENEHIFCRGADNKMLELITKKLTEGSI